MEHEDLVRRWRRRCETVIGIPATEGNAIDLLRNGDEIFAAMLEAIEHAERSVDLLTYVYWSGEVATRFADALGRRGRDGLRVRVLLDGIGAKDLDAELVERMRDAGCDVRYFRPVETGHLGEVNHRTHRKILVCDDRVGFTGGVGIADEWEGDARDEHEWRDTHVRVEGPAVDGLRGAFLDNWFETGAHLAAFELDPVDDHGRPGRSTVQVVRGASEVGESDLATLFELLFLGAERRLRLTTAYFAPPDHVAELLVDAVGRGVEVQLLVPGPHHDKRFVQMATEARYEELLEAGIEILSFQPTMLHAKVLTVDGTVATIGSANFNNRSMDHDEEVNLVVFDPDVVRALDEHFDHDLERSVALDPSRWADRSVVQKAAEQATNLLSDLF